MTRSIKYAIGAVVAVIAMAGAGSPPLHAQTMTQETIQVTVALIYRSCDFVTWPEDAFESENAELVIGVYGSSDMTEALEDATKGLSVKSHPIKIVEVEDLSDTGDVHVLYISGRRIRDFAAMPDEDKNKHATLTVSESADFMKSGGILRIYVKDNKPRLQINVDAASRQQLVLNTQLLKLAEVYREDS